MAEPNRTRTIEEGLDYHLYKSSAADPLPTGILHWAADLLLPFFAYLFNLSFDCGTFPSCFKDAFLTPVLKKLPASDPSSYRPISNLSVISKLLERLVAKQCYAMLHGL